MLLRRTKQSPPMEIMNGLVPETVQPGDYRFRLTEKNVKNQLIFRVAERMNESFVDDFIAYLNLIGEHKLDDYNTVTFQIREHGTRVHVVTPSVGSHLILEVSSLNHGPPKDMMKKDKWYTRLFR